MFSTAARKRPLVMADLLQLAPTTSGELVGW